MNPCSQMHNRFLSFQGRAPIRIRADYYRI